MRLGAVDIGTNSIRLLIAEIQKGQLKIIRRQDFMTRIGQDLQATGYINASAARSSLEALRTIAAELHKYKVKHYRVVATNALREAKNAGDFINQVRLDIGMNIEIISGLKEAELTATGALTGKYNDCFTVIDIGGGSTEFIITDTIPVTMRSIPLGAVTATEKAYHTEDMQKILRQHLTDLMPELRGRQPLICGGTATTLAAIKLKLNNYSAEAVQGQILTVSDINSIYNRLSALSLDERRHLPGLEPQRADIILAGTLIIKTIAEYLETTAIIVSSSDILEGVINTLYKNLTATRTFLASIENFILEEKLLKTGEHILVGVSGGADSMALLSVLQKLSSRFSYRLSVAHLNHLLRPEAKMEADFVENYCRSYGIPFYTTEIDIRSKAQTARISIETAARKARYSFFEQTAETIGATAIAVAHHQDDRVETVLFNFLRGSGSAGLAGIPPRNGAVVRPLLRTGKADILAYLDATGLTYMTDASNKETIYTRNRIRLELIPYLENNFNPQIKSAVLRLSDIIREEEIALNELTSFYRESVLVSADTDKLELNITALQKLPLGLQRRLLREALEKLGGKTAWTLRDIERLTGFMQSEGSSRFLQLKKGLEARKIYQTLYIGKPIAPTTPYHYELSSLPATLPIVEAEIKLEFSLIETLPEKTLPNTIYLDKEKLLLPLSIRSRLDGDIFHPAGLRGQQKLKKFFINHKIPHRERENYPVLVDSNGSIKAIIGLKADQSVVARPQTAKILQIKLSDLQ